MPLLFLEVWLFPFSLYHKHPQNYYLFNLKTKIEMNTQAFEIIVCTLKFKVSKTLFVPEESKAAFQPFDILSLLWYQNNKHGLKQLQNKTLKDDHDNKKHTNKDIWVTKRNFLKWMVIELWWSVYSFVRMYLSLYYFRLLNCNSSI